MTQRPPTIPFIRIDRHPGGTLQGEIYSAVRAAILNGLFPPGTRLLSSRALAEELGVSRTTTLLALDQLMAEGYLTTRHGSGTFVAHELPDDLPHGRSLRPASPRHPPLSRRGEMLVNAVPPARFIPGPSRAFRMGTPALELFPMRVWSQLVNRRQKSLTPAQLGYAAPSPLREAIADHVRSARGTECEPDQVYVVAGAQRGLDLMFRLLLDPGDEAWIEEPGYPGAWTALIGAGARPLPVPVDAEGLDVEAARRLGGRARLAYVTPSHQFPLGMPMTLPRRLALLKWASAAGAWVLEDDYDSEFRYGARPIPCLHGLDSDGRVIYLGTFSKALSPMLRLGFVVVPPDLQEAMFSARRAVTDIQPPFVDQAVLADFMTEGHFERHLRRMRAVYRERLEALVAAAERYCGGALRVRPVSTGLHAVADLIGVDALSVLEEANARGVEASPLSTYFFGGGPAPNALVLGFGAVPPEALEKGMQTLAASIEAVHRAGRAKG